MKYRIHGYTLVEVLVVVSILGISSTVMMPDLASTQITQLEVAANEVADAIEFARSEASRTGKEHGVRVDASQKRIRVFSADITTAPPTLQYDVYHPLSKHLYDIDFDDDTFAGPKTITQTVNTNGSCSTPEIIIFNRYGSAFCGDPFTSIYLQTSFYLNMDRFTSSVNVTGINGRVTIE